jgi:AraC family ethanolamine operon transcriptional activator
MKSITEGAGMDPTAELHRYTLFDELAENFSGWDLDFVQLSPSEGEFELQQIQSNTAFLARASLSAQFEQRGNTAAGLRAFALMAPQSSEIKWGNRGITPRSLITFPTNDEFRATSLAHFHIFTLALRDDLLEDAARRFFDSDVAAFIGEDGSVAHCHPEKISRLRLLLVYLMRKAKSTHSRVSTFFTGEVERQICFEILNCLDQSTAHSRDEDKSKRRRAMQLSLDMIASLPPQYISVLDLVNNSGVSQRTLEYAFLDRFAISPQQYLNALRLHHVHLQLLRSDQHANTIEEIAQQHGYTQSGHFAQAYRAMYGQLPSKSLKYSF